MTEARTNHDCGHGHVWPRADGVRARCGGPGLCRQCTADLMVRRADELERAGEGKEPLPPAGRASREGEPID